MTSPSLNIITIQNGSYEENCYLIYRQGESQGILIDPGSSPEQLKAAISKAGVKPALILATHGHADHVGAVEAMKAAYQVPFWAFGEDEPIMAGAKVFASMMGLGDAQAPKLDASLKDGQVVESCGICLKVLHTPGHSPGSCCFWHEPSADLFSGDTLFEGSVGRPDLPGGDRGHLERSLRHKVYLLPDATKVWPGHGDTTTVGHEKRHNPFIRLEA